LWRVVKCPTHCAAAPGLVRFNYFCVYLILFIWCRLAITEIGFTFKTAITSTVSATKLFTVIFIPFASKLTYSSLSAGDPCRRGRLCTVDHLVVTSLDQLYHLLFTKQASLMMRSIVQSLPHHLVFPSVSHVVYNRYY